MSIALRNFQPTRGNIDAVGEKYNIQKDSEICSKIRETWHYINKEKESLISQFQSDKKIFKFSKKNKTHPLNFSIYLAKGKSGEIHFFINLGKKVHITNEGHHKVISHAIKYDGESFEKWILAKTPLKDDLKRMMVKNESQFHCMFPDQKEIVQTDLIETIPTKYIDKQYIFMPFYELGSLEQALINKRAFSPEQRQQIFLDIANAVVAFHRHNAAYRDVKPQNLLLYEVDKQFHVKLADFGLSDVLREDGIFKLNATPYVFSPEMLDLVAANKTEINREDIKPCDIWTTGLTFYRILFGGKPYEEAYKKFFRLEPKKPLDFKLAIEEWLAANFPEPADKSSLEHLIYEMLSIDPKKRPDSEQVISRLNKIFS